MVCGSLQAKMMHGCQHRCTRTHNIPLCLRHMCTNHISWCVWRASDPDLLCKPQASTGWDQLNRTAEHKLRMLLRVSIDMVIDDSDIILVQFLGLLPNVWHSNYFALPLSKRIKSTIYYWDRTSYCISRTHWTMLLLLWCHCSIKLKKADQFENKKMERRCGWAATLFLLLNKCPEKLIYKHNCIFIFLFPS